MSDAPRPPSDDEGRRPPVAPADQTPTQPLPVSSAKGPHGATPYVSADHGPSKAPWLAAAGVIAAALLVLAGVVVFGGGSKDGGEDFGSPTGTTVEMPSSSASSTTSSTTSTTAAPTTSTTVAKPGPGSGPTAPAPAPLPGATPTWDPYTYGDDWYLDGLWDRCYLGEWAACDQLYWETPVGSEYEAYGATCGWTTDWLAGGCVDWYATPTWDPYTYGDDPYLDGLWDRCYLGDWAACDQLYWETPVGSEYEAYGATCGWTTDWLAGGCVDWYATPTWDPYTYGDDPYLDGLWDQCSWGDMVACDILYWDSPVGSEYESFGATCGWTSDWLAGDCEFWTTGM